MSLKIILVRNWPNNNWCQEGIGGWEKDFKICMVMMVSAEALQSDLFQIFPNFHDFWQSYCQRYPSPTRKQKPWESFGPVAYQIVYNLP